MSSTSRVAIVTGAARGIGASIAERLADDGHAIAVIDLDEAACAATVERIAAAGGRAIAVGANVAAEQAVAVAVERVTAELGAPTILINNAGVIRDNLLFKMTTDDWDTVMNVHLRGSFLMARAVQAHMTAAGWGRIVNLSSTSALGNRGQANYAAAKAGMQGFTKTLAIELGRFGVTVNAIAPGFTLTEASLGLLEDAETYGVDRGAIKRAGQPDDIVGTALFLASDQAGYLTGQTIVVDGGKQFL